MAVIFFVIRDDVSGGNLYYHFYYSDGRRKPFGRIFMVLPTCTRRFEILIRPVHGHRYIYSIIMRTIFLRIFKTTRLAD